MEPIGDSSSSENNNTNSNSNNMMMISSFTSTSSMETSSSPPALSRYEGQKRRDWHTFGQYLKNHIPPLSLSRCSSAHVLEFLRYLDQFGKLKFITKICLFYGHPNPPAPCPCPLRQAWGSLDALIGRLRAAFEENGGKPEANPFLRYDMKQPVNFCPEGFFLNVCILLVCSPKVCVFSSDTELNTCLQLQIYPPSCLH
ncbi:hypothetical protein MKW94_016442 [Papaver nudicaule]|uniref:ALOG domain-containing protein n=1 Tax=Papaver nudicaule TaxID=74823 RepID=A0AA41S7E6_PAPNU|nr:hypothetical protein [Papaver nudicaule]